MPSAIVQTDSFEYLKRLPENRIDAVVTDPPFGIGKQYNGKKEESASPEAYWDFISPAISEIIRVVKPGGLVAIWQSQVYFPYFWDWYGKNIKIYMAAKNFVQIRKKSPFTFAFDPVVMFYKDGAEPLRNPLPKRNLDFFVSNTAALVSDPSRLERGHPYPRPLDVVREIIRNFVLPGGVVLDPFLGSGTTVLAAHLEGCSGLGIEREAEYVNIAEARCNKHLPAGWGAVDRPKVVSDQT